MGEKLDIFREWEQDERYKSLSPEQRSIVAGNFFDKQVGGQGKWSSLDEETKKKTRQNFIDAQLAVDQPVAEELPTKPEPTRTEAAIASLKALPALTVGAAAQSIRGGDLKPGDDGLISRAIKWGRETGEELQGKYPNRDIPQITPSVAYSLATAGAGLATGVPTGIISGPGGLVVGGATTGTVAFRAAKDMFVNDIYDKAKNELGRELTPEEWAPIQSRFDEAATKYGLWEAVPEAVSQMAMMGLVKIPAKIAAEKFAAATGKEMVKQFVEKFPKMAKGLGLTGKLGASIGEELTTETITQHGQGGLEAEAGLREKAPGWGESFQEVAKPTVEQTLLLYPFFAGAEHFGKKRTGPSKNVKPTPAQVINLIDNGMTTGKTPQGEPFTPTHATALIKEAHNQGIIGDVELEVFKEKHPALGESINGIVADKAAARVRQATEQKDQEIEAKRQARETTLKNIEDGLSKGVLDLEDVKALKRRPEIMDMGIETELDVMIHNKKVVDGQAVKGQESTPEVKGKQKKEINPVTLSQRDYRAEQERGVGRFAPAEGAEAFIQNTNKRHEEAVKSSVENDQDVSREAVESYKGQEWADKWLARNTEATAAGQEGKVTPVTISESTLKDEAKKNGIIYNGIQEGVNGEKSYTFQDPESGSFQVDIDNGQTLEEELAKTRESFRAAEPQQQTQKGKEPWKMTKGEYNQPEILYKWKTTKTDVEQSREFIDRQTNKGIYPKDAEWTIEEINGGNYLIARGFKKKSSHESWVRKAIATGENVPPEVLKDYPDLAENAKGKTENVDKKDVSKIRFDPDKHSLSQWVRIKGGINESGMPGEAKHFRQQPGGISLFNKKTGLSFDQLSQMAKAEGFPVEDIRSFIDNLERDLTHKTTGSKIYSKNKQYSDDELAREAEEYYKEQEELNNLLRGLQDEGIDEGTIGKTSTTFKESIESEAQSEIENEENTTPEEVSANFEELGDWFSDQADAERIYREQEAARLLSEEEKPPETGFSLTAEKEPTPKKEEPKQPTLIQTQAKVPTTGIRGTKPPVSTDELELVKRPKEAEEKKSQGKLSHGKEAIIVANPHGEGFVIKTGKVGVNTSYVSGGAGPYGGGTIATFKSKEEAFNEAKRLGYSPKEEEREKAQDSLLGKPSTEKPSDRNKNIDAIAEAVLHMEKMSGLMRRKGKRSKAKINIEKLVAKTGLDKSLVDKIAGSVILENMGGTDAAEIRKLAEKHYDSALEPAPENGTTEEDKKSQEPQDLSQKSLSELVNDAFDIINDHLKSERGSFSTEKVDQTIYDKLKPIFAEIARRAKEKMLDVRSYLFGAVDSQPGGKAKALYEAAARQYADELKKEGEAKPEKNPYTEAVGQISGKADRAKERGYEFAFGPSSKETRMEMVGMFSGGDADRLVAAGITIKKIKVEEKPKVNEKEPTTPETEKKPIHVVQTKGNAEGKVARILTKLGIQKTILEGEDGYYKVVNPPYQDLVIERHPSYASNRYSGKGDHILFTHYYEQNGDLIMDGEMVYKVLDFPNGQLELVETATQNPRTGGESRGRDFKFANMFAQNLLDQGFGDPKKLVNNRPKEEEETPFVPKDDWRNNLIKAREYAIALGIPLSGKPKTPGGGPHILTLDDLTKEIIAKENLPEDYRLEKLSRALTQNDEGSINGGKLTYKIKYLNDTKTYYWTRHETGKSNQITKGPAGLNQWDKEQAIADILENAEAQLEEPGKPAAEAPKEEKTTFAKGDRVVINKGHNQYVFGRHGEISNVISYSMVDVFGNKEVSHSVVYDVKTDNGATHIGISQDFIEKETEKPAAVVKDISIDGRFQIPDVVYGAIWGYKKNEKSAKERSHRARLDSKKKQASDEAKDYADKARRYQEAFDAWAKEYPEEAEKIRPTQKAKTPDQAGAQTLTDPTKALETAGLSLRKTTTKNGKAVWELTGETRKYMDGIKRAGGRWYGPKKAWSFYQEETPAQHIFDTLDKFYTHPDMTPWKKQAETTSPEVELEISKQEALDEGHTEEEITEAIRDSEAEVEALTAGKKNEEAEEEIGKAIDNIEKELTILTGGENYDDSTVSTFNAEEGTPESGEIRTGGTSSGNLPGTEKGRGTGQVREGESGQDASGVLGENGEPDSGNRPGERGAPSEVAEDERDRTHDLGGDNADLPGVQRPRDYRITEGAIDRTGGWPSAARRNLDAIQLVKQLEQENRKATPEEQESLAKFVGWGASELANNMFPGYSYRGEVLPDWLSGDKEKTWKEHVERLVSLLTPEETRTAAKSTQYAHYTSEAVIRSIYSALDRMGFPGGKILEPGCGVGNFIGLIPDKMKSSTKFTGIEMDHLTAKIAQQLYQRQNVIEGDFIQTKFPPNYFDVAIGNPPFSKSIILLDPEYKKNRFSLHDYFFAKSLDRVRPGGLLVFVTSRYTMDKQNDKARRYLSDRADLLGAIRLPQTAFKQNAGTEVVTDVLFLRKRAEGEMPAGEEWKGLGEVSVGEDKTDFINEYYLNHPEMVLGKHSNTGSMYGPEQYTVEPLEGNIEEHFQKAIENLPENIYSAVKQSVDTKTKAVVERDFNPANKKEGGLYLNDKGQIMIVDHGSGISLSQFKPKLTPKDHQYLKDYMGVRDAVKQCHYDQVMNLDWEASLKKCEKSYDAFVKKHGFIRDFKLVDQKVENEDGEIETIAVRKPINEKLLKTDEPEWTLATALEEITKDGKIKKSKFFSGRSINVPAQPEIKTVADALAVSLNTVGRLDLNHLAGLSDKSVDEVINELGDLIYKDPGTGEHILADEYLSGEVVKKLDEAIEIARIEPEYKRNVEALKKVQPEPLTADKITVNLGSTWVPIKHYTAFANEVLDLDTKVTHNTIDNVWKVGAKRIQGNRGAEEEWGTSNRGANEILESILNNSPIKVSTPQRNEDGSYTPRFDPAATEAANDVAKKMKARFGTWIWTDAERANEIQEIYNKQRNNLAGRKFDGSHLTLPGVSLLFKLHDHQKRAIWRIIQTGNTYLGHAVGAGKTVEMICAGMEMKRLGLVEKPIYVVPKHMLGQFSADFRQLYPLAHIMVADEENFTGDNRRRFVSQATLNKPDGIVITQPAFERIRLKPETIQPFRDDLIQKLRDALAELEDDPTANRFRIKRMEARIEAAEQKFDSLTADTGKDNAVNFEDMGADFIFCDEAHAYRKLDFVTNRQAKGIDPNGSRRAMDMFIKTQYLNSVRPGRSHVFASGTPITNTVAELYSIMRFFIEPKMVEEGIDHFDTWANEFGDMSTRTEPNPAGTYSSVDRFNEFVNIPELMTRVRSFMDVLTTKQMIEELKKQGKTLPDLAGGKPKIIIVQRTEDFKNYQEELQQRWEAAKDWKPTPTQKGNPDPLINIIGDGKLATIDMRFVKSRLPSNPDSKLNRYCDEIIETYKKTKDLEYNGDDGKPSKTKGSTQICFFNIGFGEMAAQNRGFNAKAWVTKRLKEGGIPTKDIVWIDDYPTASKKEIVLNEFRTGERRILLGSAKKMGTGLNVQDRLTHLQYLDPPWYPSDIEQPMGRLLRLGNQNKSVFANWFGTKGSYDEHMWGLVSGKSDMIQLAMSGDPTIRKASDIAEVSQYEQASAVLAGDERRIRLVKIQEEMNHLRLLQQNHFQSQNELSRKKKDLAWDLERENKWLVKLKKAAKVVGDEYISDIVGKADGKTYDRRADFGEAIANKMAALLNSNDLFAEEKKKAKKGTDWFKRTIELGTINGIQIDLHVATWEQVDVNKNVTFGDDARVSIKITEDVEYDIWKKGSEDNTATYRGLVDRAVRKLNDVENEVRKEEGRIKEVQEDLAKVKKAHGAPFEYGQELAEKVAEYNRLDDELRSSGSEATEQGREDELNNPLASRGLNLRGVKGTRKADIENSINPILARLKIKPKVTVVKSYDELPQDFKTYFESQGGGELEGVINPDTGEIFLVADSLPSIQRAQATLFHELYGHYGAIELFGDRFYPFLQKIYLSYGPKGLKDITELYGLDLNTKDGRMEAAAEKLAQMAETNEKPGILQQIYQFIRDWLRKMGFDLKLTDADLRDIISKKVKPYLEGNEGFGKARGNLRDAGLLPMASQKAQTFYSQMQKVLVSKLPNKVIPQQGTMLLDTWANRGEFKKEELEWSGVKEWLAEQKGNVSKQEMLDFLKANQIEIREVTKKGGEGLTVDEQVRKSDLEDKATEYGETSFDDSRLTREERQEYLALEQKQPSLGRTKFSQYTLPGGENYREMLLTLPMEKLTNKESERLKDLRDFEAGGLSDEEYSEKEELEKKADIKHLPYISPHWDEPNVLAHVRMDDRTDSDGKRVLFIEEIQSDWHQGGKKKGYGRHEPRPLSAEEKELKELNAKTWTDEPLTAEEQARQVYLQNRYGIQLQQWANGVKEGVPNAPFKTTWPLLAVKRMIRYASENGYDRIAWTTGEQQAERYDLNKAVDSIEWEGTDKTVYLSLIGLKGISDQTLEISADRKSGIIGTMDIGAPKEWEGKHLSDVIGKELAEKVLLNPKGKLTEEGLRVGGSGMKVFYDQILPAEVNKYVKKWGAKVGTTEILTEKEDLPEESPGLSPEEIVEFYKEQEANAPYKTATVLSLDITPAMQKAVMLEGQPLFSRRQEQDLLKKPDIPVIHLSGSEISSTKQEWEMRDAVKKYAKKFQGNSYANNETGWSFKISKDGYRKITGGPELTIADMRAVAALPQLIKNAVLGESYVDRKSSPQIQMVHRFYAPVDIKGTLYRAKLTIKEYRNQTHKFYALEAVEIESPAVNAHDVVSSKDQLTHERPAELSKISIADLLQNATKNDGTKFDFVKGEGNQEKPDGLIFFSRKKTESEDDWAKRILESINVAPTEKAINQTVKLDSDFKKNYSGYQKAANPNDPESVDPQKELTPEEMGNWLKSEWDILAKTAARMKPKNIPNSSIIEQLLASPEFYQHPILKELVDLAQERNSLFYDNLNYLNTSNGSESVTDATKALAMKGVSKKRFYLLGKTSDDYKLLQAIIDEGDIGQKAPKQYEEEMRQGLPDFIETSLKNNGMPNEAIQKFRKNGIPEEVINVWKMHRESYDKTLDMLLAPLEELMAKYEEDGRSGPDFIKVDDGKGNQKKLNLKQAIAEMKKWKGSYAPRIREVGDWVVTGYRNIDGQKEKVLYRRNYSWQAERLAKKLRSQGFTVPSPANRPHISERTYQIVKVMETAKFIEQAANRTDTGNFDAKAKFLEGLFDTAADMFRERGFRSHMIHRQEEGAVVKGYIEDPNERFVRYISNVSAGIAKAETAKKMVHSFFGEYDSFGERVGGVDQNKEPKVYDVGSRYIEEQLRNTDASDRFIALIKSIATFKYLGFNPRSMAVNATAMLTTVPASLHEYAGNKKASFMAIGKELGKAIQQYGRRMINREVSLSKEEETFLAELERRHYADPQYARDASGTIRGAYGRTWSNAMEASMWAFGKEENLMRGATMLAGFRLARKAGFSYEEAIDRAQLASNRAHGIYGRATLPIYAQGNNIGEKFVKLFYAYLKFPHTYLQTLYDLKMRRDNIKAFMWQLAAPIVLGGAAAVPFKGLIIGFIAAVMKALGDDRDPEKMVWDGIREQLGPTTERAGRLGLTGLAGVDLSGSLSIGVGIPQNIYEVFGVGGGLAKDFIDAKNYLVTRQPGRAVEKVLPTGISNIFRAQRESTTGATSSRGRRVFNDDGSPYVPSSLETVLRTAGFRSSREAVLASQNWEKNRESGRYKETHDNILEAIRANALNPDKGREQKINDDIAGYNDRIIESGNGGKVPFITQKSIDTQEANLGLYGTNPKNVTTFKENLKQVKFADEKFSELRESDRAEAENFDRKHKRIRMLAKTFTKAETRISKLRKRKKEIGQSERFSPEQKQAYFKLIDQQMERIAEFPNRRFEAAMARE